MPRIPDMNQLQTEYQKTKSAWEKDKKLASTFLGKEIQPRSAKEEESWFNWLWGSTEVAAEQDIRSQKIEPLLHSVEDLFSQLEACIKKLQELEDSSEKSQVRLLRLAKEFEDIRMKIAGYSTSILAQISLNLNEGHVADKQTFQSQLALLKNSHTEEQTKIRKQIDRLQLEIQEEEKKSSQASVHGKISELMKEYGTMKSTEIGDKALVWEFLDLDMRDLIDQNEPDLVSNTVKEAAYKNVKPYLHSLSSLFSQLENAKNELEKWRGLATEENLSPREKGVILSKIYQLELTLLKIVSKRFEMMTEIRKNLDSLVIPYAKQGDADEYKNNFAEKVNKLTQKYKEEILEIDLKLKDFQKQMRTIENLQKREASLDIDSGVAFVIDPESGALLDLFKLEEQWALKPLGLLLAPSESMGSLDYYFGLGFKSRLDALKSEKHALEFKLKHAKLSAEEKSHFEKELKKKQKSIYYEILKQIIEVVGQKQTKLKNADTSATEQRVLKEEIKLLHKKFEKILDPYEKIVGEISKEMEDKSSFFVRFLKSVAKKGFDVLTFRMFSERSLDKKELTRKLYYADLGYSMRGSLTDFLNNLKWEENDEWQDVLVREVKKFLKWAHDHPYKASEIMGDMALTVSVINNKSLTDSFNDTIKANAFTLAFFNQTGEASFEGPLETEEELKYLALSQVCESLPYLFSIGRGIANAWQNNPGLTMGAVNIIKGIFDIGSEAMKVSLQKEMMQMAKGREDLALTMAQVARGDDWKRILEVRRDKELVQSAGVLHAMLIDPKGMGRYLKKEAALWWNTFKASKGWEKAGRFMVQIVAPTVIVGGAITLAVLGTLGTGGLGLGVALPVALLLLTTGYPAIRLGYYLINTRTNTRSVEENLLEKREKADRREVTKAKVLSEKEYRDLIAKQRDEMISELRQKGTIVPLSKIPKNEKVAKKAGVIKKQLLDLKERKIGEYQDKLNSQILSKDILPLKDYVDIFAGKIDVTNQKFMEGIDMNEIRKDILVNIKEWTDKQNLDFEMGDPEILAQELADEVYDSLVDYWLKPHIELALVEKLLDLSENYGSLEDYKKANKTALEAAEKPDQFFNKTLQANVAVKLEKSILDFNRMEEKEVAA